MLLLTVWSLCYSTIIFLPTTWRQHYSDRSGFFRKLSAREIDTLTKQWLESALKSVYVCMDNREMELCKDLRTSSCAVQENRNMNNMGAKNHEATYIKWMLYILTYQTLFPLMGDTEQWGLKMVLPSSLECWLLVSVSAFGNTFHQFYCKTSKSHLPQSSPGIHIPTSLLSSSEALPFPYAFHISIELLLQCVSALWLPCCRLHSVRAECCGWGAMRK